MHAQAADHPQRCPQRPGCLGRRKACAGAKNSLTSNTVARSRRGPTALHLAREAGRHIIGLAGLAPRRRSRLTSNVRPRMPPVPQASTAISGFENQSLLCSRLAGAAPALFLVKGRRSFRLSSAQLRGVHASAPCVHRAFHHLCQPHYRRARCPHAASRAWPNPSFEARPNGVAPCPRGAWGT